MADPPLPRPALPPLVRAETGHLPARPPRLVWEAYEVQFSVSWAGPACTAELVRRLAQCLETPAA